MQDSYVLSKSLQNDIITLGMTQNSISSVIKSLENKRDAGFAEIWRKKN